MLTLALPSTAVEKLVEELRSSDRQEIGGIMMGEQLAPNHFILTEMTFQRHGGMFARFVRNAQIALGALQRFFSRTGHHYRRFNYLGEWHSHPSFGTRPSAIDHDSMVELASNENTGANFVLLMIARLDDVGRLQGSVTVYLPDGTSEQGDLAIDCATKA